MAQRNVRQVTVTLIRQGHNVSSERLANELMSPVYFVLISLTLSSAMLSVIFFIAWKTQGEKIYALTWSVTFLVATVQWLANLSQDLFPAFNSYWIVVNGLTLLTVSLGLLGHCQRVQSTWKFCRNWVPPLVCFATIVWFTVIHPHAGMRIGLMPAYAATTLLISAILVLNFRDSPRAAEWGAATVMIVFAVSQYAAAIAGFLQGPVADPELVGIYNMINFLALPAAYTGMGMFVIFMLASDLSEQMKEIAVKDQLTGLLNRRGFNEAAANIYATARRTDRPLSVIMTDIDRFKSINDLYGHGTGDHALCHFAEVLSQQRRSEDILARVGGEEFALVLPGTTVEEGIQVAEKLCRMLEDSPMETGIGPLAMTASFGVATISINDTCLPDIVMRADAALYRSKRAGRNRVDLESSQMLLMPGGELKPISG